MRALLRDGIYKAEGRTPPKSVSIGKPQKSLTTSSIKVEEEKEVKRGKENRRKFVCCN